MNGISEIIQNINNLLKFANEPISIIVFITIIIYQQFRLQQNSAKHLKDKDKEIERLVEERNYLQKIALNDKNKTRLSSKK
jgi:hypothetical protein